MPNLAKFQIKDITGVLRCARYAFGPNRLHYCGPDANKEILSYIKAKVSDPGLEILLKNFKTMYPYLKQIAQANKIFDPFDERVVEAYWLGNSLLENVKKKDFYRYLIDEQKIKKRLGSKDFRWLEKKISRGALPHHSFHVLNIWIRTGNLERLHTLESIDSCRISWGNVVKIDGPFIFVLSEPLIYQNGKLVLGKPMLKKLNRYFNENPDIEELKVGDIVSIHWNVPCEVINLTQMQQLKKYTLKSITLANQII